MPQYLDYTEYYDDDIAATPAPSICDRTVKESDDAEAHGVGLGVGVRHVTQPARVCWRRLEQRWHQMAAL